MLAKFQEQRSTKNLFIIIVALLVLLCLNLVSAKEKENIKLGLGKKIKGPVIGIDLGTTYSVVAIYRNNASEIIPNELGNRITPSVVSFTEEGERLIGEAAKNNAIFSPKNTFYDVKRLIGRRYSELSVDDLKLFSYDVVNKDGKPYVKVIRKAGVEEELMAPEQISAMVLQKMKSIAEKHLGQDLKYAVITVPAYFNDQQRQATADAGKIAGLEVLRIVNEPTAASMAYGLYKEKEQNILVFDLGGGTFDVSLLGIDDGVFEVIATAGDTHLGGEDFDLRVVEHFVKEFKKKTGKDINSNKKAFQKLKLQVERAKRELSSETEAMIEIESIMDGIDFSEKLSRALFERLNMDLFQKTLDPVRQVLKDSQLEKEDIDEVVLVGGSTRIPKVRELLSEFFNGKKLNMEVNPDEAVADGASVQGAILSGEPMGDRQVILVDVAPLSLGIETEGGGMAVIIPRNTPIPCDKSDTFTTTHDGQDRLVVPIYEGERKMAKYNRLLGSLELQGIPPAPRGVPQITIQFLLDQNGILKVIATDKGTNNRREVTIQKGTFSQEEIDKMTEDAEKHAEEDRQFVARTDAMHKLERYIEEVNNQISSSSVQSKIPSNQLASVAKVLKEGVDWLRRNKVDNTSKEDYIRKKDELFEKISPVFASLYGKADEKEPHDEF